MRVLGVSALLAFAAGLAGADEEGDAVLRVVKAFGKLDSYQVEFKAQGGEAEGADHRIVTSSVDRTWSAEVHGALCKLDGGTAWRPRLGAGQGAIKEGMVWKALLSTSEGALLDRLFVRPEDVLARVRALKSKARWAPTEGNETGPVAPSLQSSDEPGEPEKTDAAGTREKRKPGKGASKAGPTASTHRLVIEGPPQMALDQFIALQNSGCMSGG